MAKKVKEHRISIRATVDEQTYKEAQDVLKALNIRMRDVIGMLCNQIALHKKIPFEIKVREQKEG